MKKQEQYIPYAYRQAFLESLPQDSAIHGTVPKAEWVYLPIAHRKALHPNSILVQGMRGAGKSFWCAALQNAGLRRIFGHAFDLTEDTAISVGFDENAFSTDHPTKDCLAGLMSNGVEARWIWLAVVFDKVAGAYAPKKFQNLKKDDWHGKIDWLRSNINEMNACWQHADAALRSGKQYHIVLFDALDRMADDWDATNRLMKGILQIGLETRVFSRIRLKIFARPDQLASPAIMNFTDASKLVSQSVSLEWQKRDLFGLLWQHLINGESFGPVFREHVEAVKPGLSWDSFGSIYFSPRELDVDSELQRNIFHSITGPWMGRNKKRGIPYAWLPNHLGDTYGAVSPRSFLHALRNAAENPSHSFESQYVLDFEDIKYGVQKASQLRASELKEDYPWISILLDSLEGTNVPCSFEEMQSKWEESSALKKIHKEKKRLPPIHLNEGASGVLQDLIELGIAAKVKDNRINIPDVYRVGYGMGRFGGVRGAKGL